MNKRVFDESVNNYQAPEVEIIEVEVEKGFAVSDGNVEDPDYGGEV